MEGGHAPSGLPARGTDRSSRHRQERRPPLSRRALLRLGMLGVAGADLAGPLGRAIGAVAGDSHDEHAMIVRSRRPLNLEGQTTAFDQRLTPNDAFFVRSHFGAPAIDLGPWEVEVVGLVKRPLRLSLDAMAGLESVTRAAVLQCAGNGRGLYRPRVPGVPWERGAVGQAEWSGASLADLLERAGVEEGAAHLHFHGGDSPPSPKTPAFVRSIPIDRAREASTLLALKMNGEPLPAVHGGPVRLVVPGWAGNNWFKWVRRIVVSRDEAPGFYMQTAYRMPRTTVPPGAPAGAVPADPVTWMNVKSLIARPARGEVVDRGPVDVRGVAWTGPGHVTRVEVRIGPDGPWTEATLKGDTEVGAWRQWSLTWTPPRPGRYTIAARATDSDGKVQPDLPAWNKSGYLWNGYDTVELEVR